MRISGRESPHTPGTVLLDVDSESVRYDGRVDADGAPYALPDSHCEHGVPADAPQPAKLHVLP